MPAGPQTSALGHSPSHRCLHMEPFSPLIEQAIELAAQWHDQTYRKSESWREPAFELPDGEPLRTPVMAHVTAVAMTVQRAGFEDEVVAAAFLHDVLEDANRYQRAFRFDELIQVVGGVVAELVNEVTERKLDEMGVARSWAARKADYVEHLRDASTGAVAISLADKLHNLWSLNQTLEKDRELFTGRGGSGPFNAGPGDSLRFFEDVLKASMLCRDARLKPLQDAVSAELHRFRRLADV